MSLLDHGPHTAQVENTVAGRDAYNGVQRSYGPATTVRCSVQPLRADEANSLGLQADTAYTIICRSWPGSIGSRVTWRGRTWFQHGDTLHHGMSPRTEHDRAVIVAQSGEGA